MKLTIIKLLILFLIGIILYFLINVYNTFSIGAPKNTPDLLIATSSSTNITPPDGSGDDGDGNDPRRWCKPSGGCGCFSNPAADRNGVTLTTESLQRLIDFVIAYWGDGVLQTPIRELLDRVARNRELVFRTPGEFNDFFETLRGTPDMHGNLVFPTLTPMQIHVDHWPKSAGPSPSGGKSPGGGKSPSTANQPRLPVRPGVGGQAMTSNNPQNSTATFGGSTGVTRRGSVALPTANRQTVTNNTAAQLTGSGQATRALPDTATQQERDKLNKLIMGEIETEANTGDGTRRGHDSKEAWSNTKKDTHKRSPTEWGASGKDFVTPGTWSPINWRNNALGRWDEWRNIHDSFGQPTFVNKGIHTKREADGSVSWGETARRARLGWQDWREQAAKPIKHALDNLGTQGLGKSGISKSLLDALRKLAQIPILSHKFVDPTATRFAFTPAGVRPVGTTGVGEGAQINPNLTFMQELLSGFTGGLMVPQFGIGFPDDGPDGLRQEDPQEHWANNTWVGDEIANNFHQKDIQAVHDRLFDPSGIDFQRTRHENIQGGPSMLRPQWGPQRCWLPLVWEPALAQAKTADNEKKFRENDPKWGVNTLSRSRRWATCDPTTGRPNGIHIESFRDVFHESWHDLVRILRDFAKKYNLDPFDENAATPTKWTTAQRMMFLMIAAIIEFGILSDIPAMMNIIDNYSEVMTHFNELVMGPEPVAERYTFPDGTLNDRAYKKALRARLADDLLTSPDITKRCHHGVVDLRTEQRLRVGDPDATTEGIREDPIMETYITEILAWAERIRPILRFLLYTQIFRQERGTYGTGDQVALANQLFDMYTQIQNMVLARGVAAAAASACSTLPDAFHLYFKWGKPPGPPPPDAHQ